MPLGSFSVQTTTIRQAYLLGVAYVFKSVSPFSHPNGVDGAVRLPPCSTWDGQPPVEPRKMMYLAQPAASSPSQQCWCDRYVARIGEAVCWCFAEDISQSGLVGGIYIYVHGIYHHNHIIYQVLPSHLFCMEMCFCLSLNDAGLCLSIPRCLFCYIINKFRWC